MNVDDLYALWKKDAFSIWSLYNNLMKRILQKTFLVGKLNFLINCILFVAVPLQTADYYDVTVTFRIGINAIKHILPYTRVLCMIYVEVHFIQNSLWLCFMSFKLKVSIPRWCQCKQIVLNS